MDNSLFATLPAELRIYIWEFALTREEVIPILCDKCHKDKYGVSHLRNFMDAQALTATCRQIRDESKHMFYTLNTFGFVDPDWLAVRWLLVYCMGEDFMNSIRHFQVRFSEPVRRVADASFNLSTLAMLNKAKFKYPSCAITLLFYLSDNAHMPIVLDVHDPFSASWETAIAKAAPVGAADEENEDQVKLRAWRAALQRQVNRLSEREPT